MGHLREAQTEGLKRHVDMLLGLKLGLNFTKPFVLKVDNMEMGSILM